MDAQQQFHPSAPQGAAPHGAKSRWRKTSSVGAPNQLQEAHAALIPAGSISVTTGAKTPMRGVKSRVGCSSSTTLPWPGSTGWTPVSAVLPRVSAAIPLFLQVCQNIVFLERTMKDNRLDAGESE